MNIITPSVFANPIDCATVSTRTTFTKNYEYNLHLYHLGNKVNTILLTPGIHQLNAQVRYNKSNTSGDNNAFNLIANEEVSEMIKFELNIKKNTAYQIVAKTKDKHYRKTNSLFAISIKKEVAKYCDYDKQSTLLGNPNKNNYSDTIPENLQYRLDLVMLDFKAYLDNKNIINEDITIEKKTRMINTIGIVVNKNRSIQQGINILAVTPLSSAAKIGLKPNDTILSINGIDLTFDHKKQDNKLSTLTLFKNTLINLSKNEIVNIEVIRKEKNIILMSNYKELSLPSYQLKIKMN
jgi:C-terminal processing protease CtpA/Prc